MAVPGLDPGITRPSVAAPCWNGWLGDPRVKPGDGHDDGWVADSATCQRGKLRSEHPIRHRLAAPYVTMLVRTIIRDRVVDGAQIVPQQHVALRPAMRVAVFRLKLMREQEF